MNTPGLAFARPGFFVYMNHQGSKPETFFSTRVVLGEHVGWWGVS